MPKRLALVGGPDIAKYTVADKMWSNISEISGISFNFEIIPLATEQDARAFYTTYVDNQAFVGFNVALPWKQYFATLVGNTAFGQKTIINTVYKHDNEIYTINTDPLGVVRSLNGLELRNKRVLILGAGGAGQATATYMAQELSSKVYVYDIIDHSQDVLECDWISSLNELKTHSYDVIINATPLGKFYLDSPVEHFASPVDIATLREITHRETVLLEMNYLPLETLFLQLGKTLDLPTVAGAHMLVFQAAESFKRYFNQELTASQIAVVINKMQKHIRAQESAILELS